MVLSEVLFFKDLCKYIYSTFHKMLKSSFSKGSRELGFLKLLYNRQWFLCKAANHRNCSCRLVFPLKAITLRNAVKWSIMRIEMLLLYLVSKLPLPSPTHLPSEVLHVNIFLKQILSHLLYASWFGLLQTVFSLLLIVCLLSDYMMSFA